MTSQRILHHRWLTLGTLLLVGLFTGVAATAEPLHLQIPYDEVKLDEANGNILLKVRPLNLPERKVPPLASRRGDLELELLERPGEKYVVAWANVVAVKLFEERVLAEAEQQVAAGLFDAAQASFLYLDRQPNKLAGLAEAIDNFLWIQITASFRAGRPEETLALLVELHRRKPNHPGLANAYERTTLELVKAKLAAKQYRGARGLLASLARKFPETAPAAVAPFQAQLQEESTQLVAQARAASATENWGEAHSLCARALDVWPAVAEGQALARQIHERYPVVSVGVVGSSASPMRINTGSSLGDWHARRLNQVLATPLTELVHTEKGLAYRSQFGRLVQQSDARTFLLRLSSAETKSPMALTAADLAGQAQFAGEAATMIGGLRARGLAELLIEFQRPQLKPEAWLRVHLASPRPAKSSNDPSTSQTWGQYVHDPGASDRVIFKRRAGIEAVPSAPQLVQERAFADASLALLALRRGHISVLDRVPPWDVARFRSVNELRVLPYAVPTVHLLIPNPNRPLTANRTFRRALLLAIDRESILKQGLLTDQSLPGCVVISGPFPQGRNRETWSYAYNDSVEPRGYDIGVATVLMEIARAEVGEGKSPKPPPPLILAHDDQPVAKIACQSIARQLSRAGQPVSLQQRAAGQDVEEADLRYVELAIQEPLVDAWAILGPQGIAGPCSPLMLAHFRGLEAAADWPAATAQLRAIHRLTAAELPVIPLWQTTNYLAAHNGLQGLSDRPVTLYEDVLRWQVAWRQPQE